jgi:uracil-DNA glycosylase
MIMVDGGPLSGTDWDRLIEREFGGRKWADLLGCVKEERSRGVVYPPDDKVFAAFRLTQCADTKVVVVGQDPYAHVGQAIGLAFAVPRGVRVPPSLANIHRELLEDTGIPNPDHGSLEGWGRQGVLLLNAALTVRDGEPLSHWRMWQGFTDAVVRLVALETDSVFMLWGKEAQKKMKALVGARRWTVLASSHPSPLSVNSGFRGSKPFSLANCVLGDREIDWSVFD